MKNLSWLIMLLAVVSFTVGCGGTEESEVGSGSTTETEETTTETEETTEETDGTTEEMTEETTEETDVVPAPENE